ncbi:hypothetical protein [uncultured Sulfuricurvum sp.]|uniref:hypothetical protein n=1 Tax=uncultured Sulfuricurvum sp. TaxID=430693 RepID=UPI0026172E07|nr:hypothetical protein [uncultured Sulfuricurvum sp.]
MFYKLIKYNPKIILILLFIVPYIILILIFALTGRSVWNGFQDFHDEVIVYDKIRFIDDVINQEKDKRIALELFYGKSEKEAKEYVQSLEPSFQKEKEKFFQYCTNNSSNCKITTSEISSFSHSPIESLIFGYAFRTITIDYIFDADSYVFFNKIKYVGNSDDLYPQIKDSNRSIFRWNIVGYSGDLSDFISPKCKFCGPIEPKYKIDNSRTINSTDTAIIQRDQHSGQYSVQIKGNL